MEFDTFTFFKVVFWLLSPFILCFGVLMIGFVAMDLLGKRGATSTSTPSISTNPQIPPQQENKRNEQEKKKKTALQWAMEQQKKENARQKALARQAEQVRIAQAQSEHYKQFGIGH